MRSNSKFLSALLVVPLLSGCGNYLNIAHIGDTALSHDDAGNLTIHVVTCTNYPVTMIDISTPNVEPFHVGILEPETPQTGYFTIDLANPVGWRVARPLQLPTTPDVPIRVDAYAANGAAAWPGGEEKIHRPTTLTVAEIAAQPAGALIQDQWEAPPAAIPEASFAAQTFEECGR